MKSKYLPILLMFVAACGGGDTSDSPQIQDEPESMDSELNHGND
jgi:hypothetical protein